MNVNAVGGYALALGLLTKYEQQLESVEEYDNLKEVKTNPTYSRLKMLLTLHVKQFERKGLRPYKHMDSVWNRFKEVVDEDTELIVQPLHVALQLVMKNPMGKRGKFKPMTDAAFALNKFFMFSKEDSVINGRDLINELFKFKPDYSYKNPNFMDNN